MNRLITRLIVVMALIGAVLSCGGGSNESPLVSAGNTSGAERCQNAYYSKIIGRYEGEALFKVRAEDGSEAAACTWEISMDIKHAGSPVVCDLVMEIQAPVTQTIVLDAGDEDAFLCFPDESFRRIQDPYVATNIEQYENIVFPVMLDFEQDLSLQTIGPYFGDSGVVSDHHRLFDFGWIKSFVITGNGSVELMTSSGVNFPFSGWVQLVE